MTREREWSVRFALVIAVGLAACSASPGSTEPLASTTLVGEFGGDQVRLEATTSGATIVFSCAEISVDTPLVTDAAGRFSVNGGRRRTGGAIPVEPEAPTPVRVSGRAVTSNGGSIQLIVAPVTGADAPPAGADTLYLVRNRQATIFLCP